MDVKFRSMLDELTDYAPRRDRDQFIESRGQQVIASALHLKKLIEESYDAEIADDLVRRLINAIRGDDEQKFRRGIRKIREARGTKA